MMATTLGAAGTVYVHNQSPAPARSSQSDRPGPPPHRRPPRTFTQPVDTIVVGETSRSSTREASTNRVMVLHLSRDRKSAAFVSFPVNTLVPIPGHRADTIGAAYAIGGPKLIERTVEKLFDTRIEHIAYTTFDGFLKLSQQVGTVTVTNPKAFTNFGFDFPVGTVELSGAKAIAFVRGAPGDGANDEVARQQLITEAGLRKELSGNLFDSKSNLSDFIRTGSDNVTVDRQLSEMTLIRLAVSLELQPDDIDVIRVPLSDEVRTVHGQEVHPVDPVLFEELATDLARDRLGDYLAAHPQN